MAKVVSVINLKGGVAKTTTTVQLAECLASEFSKRVLVIDLDPQTNSTISLIDEDKWEELDAQGKTLFHLFNDKLQKTKKFDIEQALQRGSPIFTCRRLTCWPPASASSISRTASATLPAARTTPSIRREVLKSAVFDRLQELRLRVDRLPAEPWLHYAQRD